MGKGKRWDRSQYPEQWEALSQAFRASRDYTCEHCGVARGTWRVSKAGRSYRSRVAAAHRYPNDTRNPAPELLCLCERCHFAYDARFRGVIVEGKHQAALHEILLGRSWQEETEGEGMDEGETVAQFVRASWGEQHPHQLVEIYRVEGPIQQMWHVYYLHWMRAEEYVDTALVVYEDEQGVLQIADEWDGQVYTDEQGVALREYVHYGKP